MPDIAIQLTSDELRRLQQTADALGVSVEQLAADELRARYALVGRMGHVIPLRRQKRQGNDDGRH